jgi:biopolymer transport protein ExbD
LNESTVNFSKNRPSPEPEINLIPFIDILLVVMIFLMLTTTWSRLTEINLTLPVADAQKQKDRPKQIVLSISAQGQYALNKAPVSGNSVASLSAMLASMASKEVTLVISADAQASHQSVIHAMEAARRAGLSQITFATQLPESSGS